MKILRPLLVLWVTLLFPLGALAAGTPPLKTPNDVPSPPTATKTLAPAPQTATSKAVTNGPPGISVGFGRKLQWTKDVDTETGAPRTTRTLQLSHVAANGEVRSVRKLTIVSQKGDDGKSLRVVTYDSPARTASYTREESPDPSGQGQRVTRKLESEKKKTGASTATIAQGARAQTAFDETIRKYGTLDKAPSVGERHLLGTAKEVLEKLPTGAQARRINSDGDVAIYRRLRSGSSDEIVAALFNSKGDLIASGRSADPTKGAETLNWDDTPSLGSLEAAVAAPVPPKKP
jgi:hypothetical protein